MPIFIGVHMILDMRSLTRMLIFSLWFFIVFKLSLILTISYSLKTWCHTFDLYLFVLGIDRFFTMYICFKESLFFIFLYKLFNKYLSLPQTTCQFKMSVRKQVINSYVYYFIIKSWKAAHEHNYKFFWEGLCFNYLISTLSPLHMHKNFL